MSIALRSAADALDELGPAPEHVPAQDEVKRTLTKLSDARASENGGATVEARKRSQFQYMLEAVLESSNRSSGTAVLDSIGWSTRHRRVSTHRDEPRAVYP